MPPSMFGVAMVFTLGRRNGIPLFSILSLSDTQFVRGASTDGFAAILFLVPPIDLGLHLVSRGCLCGFIRLFFHKSAE